MKFAFDLDETISNAPAAFAAIIDSLMKNGHECHIITFRSEEWRKQTEKELKEVHGVKKWTKLWITGAKSMVCEEEGIDLAIDDCSTWHYPNFWRFICGFALPKKEADPWMKNIGNHNQKMSAGYSDDVIARHHSKDKIEGYNDGYNDGYADSQWGKKHKLDLEEDE